VSHLLIVFSFLFFNALLTFHSVFYYVLYGICVNLSLSIFFFLFLEKPVVFLFFSSHLGLPNNCQYPKDWPNLI
jgi:hypothetical protein